MECTACKTENRDIAKFCKRCGTGLAALSSGSTAFIGDPVLGNLVGLDHIREELGEIINVIRGMKKDGNLIRMNYNLILTGNSGTAKSLIGELFYKALKRLDVVTKDQPHSVDAGDFAGFDNEAVANLVKNAAGGMIIIDNAQDLITDGAASAQLKRLIVEMDKTKGDPIIILSGLPYGLREFVNNPENSNFTGRFRYVFFIDDYDSMTLFEIIKQQLAVKYGFSLTEEAAEKLLKRTAYLAREIKNPEANLGAYNGYLAMREVDSVVHEYYLRGGAGKEISAQDITGEVLEKKSAEEILARFDSFIGMDAIKKDIRSMYNRMSVEDGKGELGLHAVLTGNPGTGKTTVVRVLGDIYAALGALDTGHVVEVDRGTLVAGYQGQTAIQVNKMVDRALGGILFVDEAYALKQGETDSFGQEAIDTLLKRVEDDREKFCCIVAGYKNEMKGFLSSNPGLTSRFPKRFHLEDYNADELLAIFKLNMKQQGYTATAGAIEKAKAFFEDRIARKTKDFANGREARNLFDGAKGKLAARLSDKMAQPDFDRAELTVITEDDIPSGREEGGISIEEAMARLNSLTGLSSVKTKLGEMINTLEADRLRGTVKPLAEHFQFVGNPGTGKTTVARIFADVLYAAELIPTNNLIEADRSTLVANVSGGTAPKVNDLVDRSMGGVLFIDEAYALIQGQNDSFGMEALNTLLKRLEDDLGKFICIAAGYKKEMHDFIQANSGLKSRFTTTIDFEDYNADEMAQIFFSLAAKEGYQLTDEAAAAAKDLFQGMVARKTKDFGNAREVRKVFETTRGRLSKRIIELKEQGLSTEELKKKVSVIEKQDLPLSKPEGEDVVKKSLARLEEQIGLASVKQKVKELMNVLDIQKIRGMEKPLGIHFVFTGNPGTGKTTVARILADIFHAIGLLPSNNLVEADRSAMVAGYSGQTSAKVNALVDRAMGGVLFVDEAYTLKQRSDDSFGQTAIDTLLKRMEDDRGKFVVIAAGYDTEMENFLNTNSGLSSRFSDTIHFEDYTGCELSKIFKLFAEKEGYTLEKGLDPVILDYFTKVYENRDKNFGNARTVRKFFDAAVGNQSNRLISLKNSGSLDSAALKEEANKITRSDLPTEEL
ncbi:MAG: AAA family ATPase [Spirochaetia bacterium]